MTEGWNNTLSWSLWGIFAMLNEDAKEAWGGRGGSWGWGWGMLEALAQQKQ